MINGESGRPAALEAWMDLAEVVGLTRSAISRALQEQAGLTLAENLVLCHIAMAPDERLRMVDIADILNIAKSAVTKTVDRLEERGWVTRERDADDRRSVHATLTAAGADVFRRAQPVFAEAVSQHLEGALDDDELRTFRRLLDKIRQSQRVAAS